MIKYLYLTTEGLQGLGLGRTPLCELTREYVADQHQPLYRVRALEQGLLT